MNRTNVLPNQSQVHGRLVQGFIRRLRFALACRHLYPMAAKEAGVKWLARELLVTQDCTHWHYYKLSNGVGFIAPADWPRWQLAGANERLLVLSAEAAGLVVSLAAVREALFSTNPPANALQYLVGLWEYAYHHPELDVILETVMQWHRISGSPGTAYLPLQDCAGLPIPDLYGPVKTPDVDAAESPFGAQELVQQE